MVLSIIAIVFSGLATLIAGGTLFYEIILNKNQNKYIKNQDKLNLLYIKSFTPLLSFDKIKYDYVDRKENYLSYSVKMNNDTTANPTGNVLVSIKNYSSGIAKNIQIEESTDPSLSIKIENNKTQNINGGKEESVLFWISDSLYKKDQVFQFIISCEDTNGNKIFTPSSFRYLARSDGFVKRTL